MAFRGFAVAFGAALIDSLNAPFGCCHTSSWTEAVQFPTALLAFILGISESVV